MTKEEISKIKEHIEIHARREPQAIKITEILWKAVDELEHISELEKKNKELDGLLGVGTIFNKALNSMNKALAEERDKYRNMVFDQKDLLTRAKKIIGNLYAICKDNHYPNSSVLMEQAEQFLKECE